MIGIIAGIFLLLALPYVFIPSSIHQSIYTITRSTTKAAQRALLDEAQWTKWWPADPAAPAATGTAAPHFYYNGQWVRLSQRFVSGIELTSGNGTDSIKSLITVIPIGRDTTKLVWEYQAKASLHPFTRIAQYNKARALKQDMGFIIQQLAVYLSDAQNVYGIRVNGTTVADSLLITTKAMMQQEPDLASIYQLITRLEDYAKASGAQAVNPPMLNKRRVDSSQVEVMVALPINKVINSSGTIVFKRMPAGNLLVTEVKGGAAVVREAFSRLEHYIEEHGYESPAIPFESLVTNRQQQTDTAQWITRIYYPVF